MQITLDRRRGDSLNAQIYDRIRRAILSGGLRAGQRLPATRVLAGELAVSRATVELAYARLAGEGYIAGRGAAGTVVTPRLATRSAPATPLPPARATRERSAASRPFQLGVPAIDAFPRKLWARLVARRARKLGPGDMVYQAPAGLPALRQAIAGYLGVARGVVCDPAQVFITSGYQGALGLIARALLRPGERVWVEDPGYPQSRDALALAGLKPVAVPVDDDGLDVAQGLRLGKAARLAVVTPSHQQPLGMALALPRRLALLEWARASDAWILEDDYDGEFHYRGRPLPALKSLDANDRVIYTGTFSKVLMPGLRLAYLVAPLPLVERLRTAAELLHPPPSALAQSVVAEFIGEGHFGRHIRRMRQLYAERRTALLAALRAQGLADRVDDVAGGLHLLLRLAPAQDDRIVADRAAAHGLAPRPLSAFAVRARRGPALLLGFPNLPAEAAADAVSRLRRALGA